MIHYQHFILNNGLKVYLHQDKSTPIIAVNILYNVGSKDEEAHKTGFAHLFEHLMFGGSKNISDYDIALQRVGGENNAFTSPDITNFYITLPKSNIETAFWLESDRMLSLNFDAEVLEVQRKVVIEEFKQRYLNQPYGDLWLKIRPLAYQSHPYQWATIGKDISHIEQATMDDVKSFFYKYYLPNNATLVVAGDIDLLTLEKLAVKWFGNIPAGKDYVRNLTAEPAQKEARFLEVSANVPTDMIYKVYHMPSRRDDQYYIYDLLSDILGRSKSSRLYSKLLKEKNIFNSISAYLLGSVEPGLLVIGGKLNKGINPEEADQEIQGVIQDLITKGVDEKELEKVKNQAESSLLFSEIELLSRAMNIAYYDNLGDADLVNKQSAYIQKVNEAEIIEVAKEKLVQQNSSTLYYRAI